MTAVIQNIQGAMPWNETPNVLGWFVSICVEAPVIFMVAVNLFTG